MSVRITKMMRTNILTTERRSKQEYNFSHKKKITQNVVVRTANKLFDIFYAHIYRSSKKAWLGLALVVGKGTQRQGLQCHEAYKLLQA